MANRMASAIAKRMAKVMRLGCDSDATGLHPVPLWITQSTMRDEHPGCG